MKTTKARLLSTYRAARRNMARTFLKVGLEKAWPAAWQRAIFGSTRDLAAVKSVVRASTPNVDVVATADVQAEAVKVEPAVLTVVADEVDPIPPAADAEPVALKKPRARKPAAPKAETPKAPRKAAAKAPKPETTAKAPAAPRKRVAKAKAA
ncbi:hypothetical protein [Methylobacterium sp. WCS2018Hpa-22]|uniref:hypothetical protein n=1 Tax=Methylobacterium sp. WCS2018Hpa-22 TaxID=3073633 RepID=UPI00288C5D0A|nr:hypothetical protein [Methylobacterium sp. WCS2018Hpa-22]